jgi:hypothetical protein
LPLYVIPYDDARFELPKNAQWWLNEEIAQWVRNHNLLARKRKYQCLTTKNYQYIDTDVLFLKNPEAVLSSLTGFITSCNHWTQADTARVVTEESRQIMRARSTLWQRNVFCSGQFACDSILYSATDVIKAAMDPAHQSTCIKPPFGDQEGMNLLVFLSAVNVTNLTLPPFCMESTWPGDYPEDPFPYWHDEQKKPYLLHCYLYTDKLQEDRKINWLFRELLTQAEQDEWKKESAVWRSVDRVWDAQRDRFHQDHAKLRRKNVMKGLAARLQRAGKVLLQGYY